jgi:hypothetical protein
VQQFQSALVFPSGISFAALLYEVHSLVQDLPHQPAQPMGYGPDGGLVTQARQQPAEHGLKVTAVLLHRCVCRLIEDCVEPLSARAFGAPLFLNR